MILTKLTIPATGLILATALIGAVEGLLPVTALMRAHDLHRDGAAYVARITGHKIRSCTVIPGTFTGWYKAGGEWRETGISFPHDLTPNDSKPKSYGPIDFGLFKWQNVPDGASSLKVTVIHSCKGSLEITTVGPWLVEEASS